MFYTAEAFARAGFHLNEDHCAVRISGDHVELAVPAAPIALHDPQAEFSQVGHGDLLAEGPEFLPG